MLKIIHILIYIKVNNKDPKFIVGDRVTISKYKNNIAKKLYSKLV